jgi:tetratricopeptide (TPR) repeat protein
MNNPYDQHRLAKLKHRSIVRYVWVLITRFPAFIIWQLSRLIPAELGRRLGKRFDFLLVPFRSLIDLAMFWLTTRAWKHLAFAAPMILLLMWIFSTLFLANGMSEKDFYKPYRKSMMTALQTGNNKKADFMAGKLLAVNAYQRDEQMLFAAMIAANEMGNIPRRDMLRQLLTTELDSARTHLWSATALLSDRSRGRGNVPRAIEHIKKAITLSDNADEIKRMKMQLVNVYYRADRPTAALEILNELGVTDYRMGVLRGSIYLRNNEKLNAREAALNTLASLDTDDVNKEDYLKVNLDALSILSDAGGKLSLIEKKISELISLMEKKLALNPDDADLKPIMAQSYLLLGRTLFQQDGSVEYVRTLDAFDKALGVAEVLPAQIGQFILFVGSMPESRVRQALIQGKGVATGHILLGLNAWRKGKSDVADFHFRLATAHQPNSLRVLEYVALNYTRKPVQGNFKMSLSRDPSWRQAIALLDIAAKIDEVPLGSNLKFQCLVLAEKQRWAEIIVKLEKHIDKISGSYRVEFLSILVRAYGELGDLEKAREINQILQEQVNGL